MSNRNIGLALIILGAVLISLAYRVQPPRMLSVIGGLLFILAGVLRLLRRPRV